MPSKPIRLSLEVITELDKLRPLSPSSYSSIIKKLLRSHHQLTEIEQTDMFQANIPDIPDTPLKSPLKKQSTNKNKKTKIKPLSKNEPKLLLFCFECQEQTPHKKLKINKASPSRELYKCSICGNQRNI